MPLSDASVYPSYLGFLRGTLLPAVFEHIM
jgi:hypothetical protein